MVKHILLVDDEEEITNFMENFLKRLKVSSTRVSSGEQALAVYDKNKIDFVFLDINLQGINGFEVLKELKLMNPSVKVIIIAANGDKDSQSKAKKLGAIDYISKPIDLREVKDKITKYILS
jgi:DNA-binding NtrC family response regulator